MTETNEPVPPARITGNVITGKDGGAIVITAGDCITVTGNTILPSA